MLNSVSKCIVALVAALALGGCATGGAGSRQAVEAGDARLAPAYELMREKEFAEAEKLLLTFREQTPDDALVHTNLGIVYAHMSRLDDSAEALQRALELDPKDAVAYNELGITHRRAGRFAEAQEAYRAALEVRPDYANAHYNLGVLLDLYLLEREQALVHYERYLELDDPENKQVQAWVKDLQRRTGKGPSTADAGGEVERR